MRGTKAIENIEKWDARTEGSRLCYQRHIHCFLRRITKQHAEAGGTNRHHIAVITEDGKRMGGQRPGCNMKYSGYQFPGDLIHIGDHQEQSLRCREGGRQAPTLQCSVYRSGGSRFTLHFDDFWHLAVDVL